MRCLPSVLLVLAIVTISHAFAPLVMISTEKNLSRRKPTNRPSPPVFTREGRADAVRTSSALHTNPSSNDEKNGEGVSRKGWTISRSMAGVGMWAVSITCFILLNYHSETCWPSSLLMLPPRRTWTFVHATTTMLFSGTILVSTLVEWLVVKSRNPSVLKFWFTSIPSLDMAVVLPSLTGSIVSGIAQASMDYGRLQDAPKYVLGTFHSLLTFGAWWGVTDLTTQKSARTAVSEDLTDGDIPRVLKLRRWSNLVSCLFVATLYILMVLKPGMSARAWKLHQFVLSEKP